MRCAAPKTAIHAVLTHQRGSSVMSAARTTSQYRSRGPWMRSLRGVRWRLVVAIGFGFLVWYTGAALVEDHLHTSTHFEEIK